MKQNHLLRNKFQEDYLKKQFSRHKLEDLLCYSKNLIGLELIAFQELYNTALEQLLWKLL